MSVTKLAKNLKDLTLRDVLIIVWPSDRNLYSFLKQCFKRRVIIRLLISNLTHFFCWFLKELVNKHKNRDVPKIVSSGCWRWHYG